MNGRTSCAALAALVAVVACAASSTASPFDGLDAPSKPKPPQDDDGTYDEPWVTGTARLADRFVEGGPFIGTGGMFAVPGVASPVQLGGVRVLEHHGYVSKALIVMLIAMGQSDYASLGSSYHTDSAGNVWRTDYYRHKTPEELAEQRRQLRHAIESEYVMEMSVYAAGMYGNRGVDGGRYGDERSQARGFEFYLGGEREIGNRTGRQLPVILQIAFAMAHVRAPGTPFRPGEGPGNGADARWTTEHAENLYYTNLGVMLRAYVPVTAWFEAYAQWDLNALTLFDLSGDQLAKKGFVWTSPLRAGVNVNATDRFYARAHASLNGVGVHGLGWQAEIGVRF